MHAVVAQSSGLCQICGISMTACMNLVDLISGFAKSQIDRPGLFQAELLAQLVPSPKAPKARVVTISNLAQPRAGMACLMRQPIAC